MVAAQEPPSYIYARYIDNKKSYLVYKYLSFNHIYLKDNVKIIFNNNITVASRKSKGGGGVCGGGGGGGGEGQ